MSSRAGQVLAWARTRSLDATLGALATLFGLVSLSYPLARDHGLFFYGAREWLLRDQVLYRDILDHKTPGIYAIYAAAIALFGQNAWGIRVLELAVGVPAAAWVAARLASKRGAPIAPGVFGAAWIGASIADFGYLSYWDGAQCELWFTLFATAALAAVLHARRPLVGAAVAGVLSAFAVIVKPPSLPFVLLAVGAIAVRAREERREERALRTSAVRLGAFSLAGLAVGACVVAYFAAKHAIPQMIDLVVGVNNVQVRSGPGVHDFGDVVERTTLFFGDYEPFSAALVTIAGASALRGFARRDWALARRYLLPVLLALACWLSVAMQRKFYLYHRASILASIAVAFAILYEDSARALAQRRGKWLAPVAFVAFVAGMFTMSSGPSLRWLNAVRGALDWQRGKLTREEFTRQFDVPNFFAYHDAELTALWLRDNTSPNQTVIARGFEPEIYALSGRYYTGRFCWSSFLTDPWRAYKKEQWLAEDLEHLRSHPPDFAVALAQQPDGVDSARFFEDLGYTERARIGIFVVLQRLP